MQMPDSGSSQSTTSLVQLDERLTALEEQVRHMSPPASTSVPQQQQEGEEDAPTGHQAGVTSAMQDDEQAQPSGQPQQQGSPADCQAETTAAMDEDGQAEASDHVSGPADGLIASVTTRRGGRKRKADTQSMHGACSGARQDGQGRALEREGNRYLTHGSIAHVDGLCFSGMRSLS